FPGIQPGQIYLKEGKPEKAPTDYTGAVRVRAMTDGKMFGPANNGEHLLGLQISPEPKIQWQQLVAINATKVVDDQDQKLAQAMNNAAAPVGPGGVVIALPIARPVGWVGGFGGGFGNVHQYGVVRIKKGEKAAKSLKEVQGTITAQVLTPPQAYITADEILKAEGKTFKGSEGGSIKIVEVKKEENGTIKVRFEMEQPANIVPGNNAGIGLPGVQIQNAPAPPGGPGAGPGFALPFMPNNTQGFQLVDDKGNAI